MARLCCSAVCWAECCAFFAAILLLIGIISPWYFVTQKAKEPDFTRVDLFWWPGMRVLSKINDESKTDTVSWDDFPSSQPKNIYMAAMGLTIIGFVFTSLLCLVLLAFMHRIHHHRGSRMFKWVVFLMSLFCLLWSFLSWVVFVGGWNKAMQDVTDSWPSSFIHTESSGRYDITYGPFLGWITVLISTPVLITAAFLALAIRVAPLGYASVQ